MTSTIYTPLDSHPLTMLVTSLSLLLEFRYMFLNNGQKGINHWGLYVLTILMLIVAYSIGQVPLMTVAGSYLEDSGSSMSILEFLKILTLLLSG